VHEHADWPLVELVLDAIATPWADTLRECGPSGVDGGANAEEEVTQSDDGAELAAVAALGSQRAGSGSVRLHQALSRARAVAPLSLLSEEAMAVVIARSWIVHMQRLEAGLYTPQSVARGQQQQQQQQQEGTADNLARIVAYTAQVCVCARACVCVDCLCASISTGKLSLFCCSSASFSV